MKDIDGVGKVAAIVLGGGLKVVTHAGQITYEPEEQAKARLDRALALFEEGKVDVIISTGDISPMAARDPAVTGPRTEAEVGVQYLLARAGEASPAMRRRLEESICYEDRSIDTISNAWYAKKRCLEPLGITVCIVVTSDYHIARSRVIFEWVLGPGYTVETAEAPSPLRGAEREQRDRFEAALTDHMRKHLFPVIPAGDDEAMGHYMENEHAKLFAGLGPGFGPPPDLPKPA